MDNNLQSSGSSSAVISQLADAEEHKSFNGGNLALPNNPFSDDVVVEPLNKSSQNIGFPFPETRPSATENDDNSFPTSSSPYKDYVFDVPLGKFSHSMAEPSDPLATDHSWEANFIGESYGLRTKGENIVKHPLHEAKGTGMWECPDFYPVSISPFGLDTSVLGGFGIKHVLKVSLDNTKHDTYVIGTYDFVKDVFVPDVGAIQTYAALRYDYGKFYASKTFYDSLKKRRILLGWVKESLPVTDYVKQGWSGIQGVPRIIWLDISKKQLQQWPIPEIEALRQNN